MDALPPAPELCQLDAAALATAYRKRDLSPVEVTKAALARAEAINPALNAFTFLDRDGALAEAKASEARWRMGTPLSEVDGVPTTLKDIVWVQGWAVRYGSETTDATPCREDAPAVRKLREAGCVFIGQTTTPEFGWKALTDSPAFGITRNPHDPSKTSGGSSGGAAVAAAMQAGRLHLGSDGGGSIRVPASFCGIFGIKPSFGRVPAYPASAFGTVAHIGPMTANVADGLAMLKAMSGRDRRDWNQGAGQFPGLEAAPLSPKGLKIGYWRIPPSGALDAELGAIIDARIAELAGQGAEISPFTLPGGDLLDLFHDHWFSGAATRLAGVPEAKRAGIDPGFLEIAAQGARMSAVQLVRAQVRRADFGAAMDAALAEYDFILSPGTAIPAFEAGAEVPSGSGLTRWTEWAGFSYPVNLTQQPAAVVPCGKTKAGLPVALQIIGGRGEDGKVMALAASLEALFA